MNKLKMFWKIMLIISAMTLFLIGTGIAGIYYLDKSQQDIYGDQLAAWKAANALYAQSQAIELLLLEHLVNGKTPEALEREHHERSESLQEFNRLMAIYEKMQNDTRSADRLSSIKRDMAIYWQANEKALQQLMISGQEKDQYRQSLINGKQAIHNANLLLKDIIDHHTKMIDKSKQVRHAEIEQYRFMLMTIICCLVIGAVMLGIFLARMISKPIQALQESIEQRAVGRSQQDSNDELNFISRFCDQMIRDQEILSKKVRQSAAALELLYNELSLACDTLQTTVADAKQQIQVNEPEIIEAGNRASEFLEKVRSNMAELEQKIAENNLEVLNAAIKATRIGNGNTELIALASKAQNLSEEAKKGTEEIAALSITIKKEIENLIALGGQNCGRFGTLSRMSQDIYENTILLKAEIEKLKTK